MYTNDLLEWIYKDRGNIGNFTGNGIIVMGNTIPRILIDKCIEHGVKFELLEKCIGFSNNVPFGEKNIKREYLSLKDEINNLNFFNQVIGDINNYIGWEDRLKKFSENQMNELLEKNNKKIKGVVYFIREIGGKLVKIGRTKDIKNRYKKYVTENPNEIEIIRTVEYEDCVRGELYWHELFESYRVRGERFKLPKHEIEFIESFTIEDLTKYEIQY